MKRMGILAIAALLAVMTMALLGSGASAAPTCSGTLDIATHGQHVVGDYVTGVGHADLDWPPSGDVGGGGGAALAGGPAAHGHFLAEPAVAPGASFCLSQSQSPGIHPGP